MKRDAGRSLKKSSLPCRPKRALAAWENGVSANLDNLPGFVGSRHRVDDLFNFDPGHRILSGNLDTFAGYILQYALIRQDFWIQFVDGEHFSCSGPCDECS